MKPEEIIDQLIAGNRQFVEKHDKNYFSTHADKQKPYITLVSCADSRVPMSAIMPDTVNKIFSIQNIGNQVLSTEGSVDYGVYHLKTPMLIILGHSDCGAIKAYMKGFEEESYNIKRELDFLQPAIRQYFGGEDFEKRLSLVIEENIDYQVNVAFKKYKDLVNSGTLTIVGMFYDFANDFGHGQGRVMIVNVNKKKKENEIQQLPFFKHLRNETKEIFIGRL